MIVIAHRWIGLNWPRLAYMYAYVFYLRFSMNWDSNLRGKATKCLVTNISCS